MENEEILKQLNSKMKKYLIYTFSLADYFKENKDIITLGDTDKKLETKEEMLTYSFFLAGLKFKEINKLFGDYNISFKEAYAYFKNKDKELELKSITKTISNNDIKLEELFNTLKDYYNMLIEDDIQLNEIEPFLVFNYIFYNNLNLLTDVLGKSFAKENFKEYEKNFNDRINRCRFSPELIDDISESIEEEYPPESYYSPALEKYGKDLTSYSYLKDPAIGREAEIRRIEQILLYPERDKSIIITGEAGCGKTALVRGLAYRIQNGNVPKALKDLKIISIDTSTLVAGTKYVGTLEEKMKEILDEASNNKNIIIFMDEIHQALSGGKAENNNNSVSEILKPYLDYGDVRIIGATTTEEYESYVEQDQAFKTRLKKIAISEPNEGVIYQILDDLISKYDEISYSKLLLAPEEQEIIIKWFIESTSEKYRTYNDKSSNPRLVIDILKETYAIAAINDHEKVTTEDIAEAFRCEDRLYKSSIERQIEKLKYLKPSKQLSKIIKFMPKK